ETKRRGHSSAPPEQSYQLGSVVVVIFSCLEACQRRIRFPAHHALPNYAVELVGRNAVSVGKVESSRRLSPVSSVVRQFNVGATRELYPKAARRLRKFG